MGVLRSDPPDMSESAGFIQSPVLDRHPFKNSSDYIDIEQIEAPFVEPDGQRRRRCRHRTINLSVVAGRYNMMDCVAGLLVRQR
jgi:hypothetical protein